MVAKRPRQAFPAAAVRAITQPGRFVEENGL